MVTVSHDTLSGLTCLRQVRRFSPQPQQATFRTGNDGCERLIDLVRERGSQLADRGQPCSTREVSLSVAQCVLAAFSRGDVGHRPEIVLDVGRTREAWMTHI